MKPHVVCLMEISLDGRIHPSRWTKSPDGDRKGWGQVYERTHQELAGDAWLIGRVTMAEMSKASSMPDVDAREAAPRPFHFASGHAKPYAITIDRRGVLAFAKPDIGGDHVVVVVGADVPDAHLHKLVQAGVSYVVAADVEPGGDLDLHALLAALHRELGIARLLVEGGGKTCGAFLAAGVVDELSLLLAPAIDGAPGIEGVFDVRDPRGLAGKVELRFLAATPVEHGMLHLRYAVAAPRE